MQSEGFPEGQAPTEEQLRELIEVLQQQGISPDEIPNIPDLGELLDNVKRKKGVPVASNSEEITPEPGFVIKTLDERGQKVFVNVCGHDKIAAPGGWADGQVPEEVKKALENAENLSPAEASVLRFPLSLGPPRLDVDRRGDSCRVFDAVLNRDVVRQASATKRLKAFLIELCLGWVAQKAKCELDPKYRLPKMKYKGAEVARQNIRVEKKSLIKEIGNVEEEPTFALPTKRITPQQRQAMKELEGRPAATGKGFSFPGSSASAAASAKNPNLPALPLSSASGTSGITVRAGVTKPQPSAVILDAESSSASGGPIQLQLESVSYEGRPVAWIVAHVSLTAADAADLVQAAAEEAKAAGGFLAAQEAASKSTYTTTAAPYVRTISSHNHSYDKPAAAVLSRFDIKLMKAGRELQVRLFPALKMTDITGAGRASVLSIPLPFAASCAEADGASAQLSEDCRTLEIRLPYVSLRRNVDAMRRRRPLSFGSLGLSSTDEALDLEP